MLRQIRLFVCALQFLTRLPVPAWVEFEADWITRSARYFPLVGQLVGAITGGVLALAASVWPGLVPPLLAIVAAVLMTGALHEDGLADTADGLGGGRDRAQCLAIMKDSRTGAYGVLALILCLALKLFTLGAFEVHHAIIILIAMHGAARAAAVVVMATLTYAGDVDAAKVKPAAQRVTAFECVLALIFAVWPLFLLPPTQALAALAGGSILALVIVAVAQRRIGGYTGDILGAVEQLFELGFLLGAAAVL